MRILGLDFGLKRVGVAVSDEGGRLASPLAVIPATSAKHLLAKLGKYVRRYSPAEVVVGEPLRLDGSKGELAGRAAAFAGEVAREFGVRVVMWDERYTSFEAGEKLRERGMKWKKRREILDRAAAAVILQSYLDSWIAEKRT